MTEHAFGPPYLFDDVADVALHWPKRRRVKHSKRSQTNQLICGRPNMRNYRQWLTIAATVGIAAVVASPVAAQKKYDPGAGEVRDMVRMRTTDVSQALAVLVANGRVIKSAGGYQLQTQFRLPLPMGS
jgi:hypothetical protein